MTVRWPPWLDEPWSRFLAMRRDDRMPHALLIAGVAGLGKRDLAARIVAQMLCEAPMGDDACGSCRSCTWRAAGTHPDYLPMGPEEGSDVVKVDQIRDLIARVQLTGQLDSTRVVVIDPADAMNMAAQNALLKTLEEPSAGVHLILLADAPSRLLATVRSRCRALMVSAPGTEAVRRWLDQDGDVHGQALALAAGHPGLAQDYVETTRAERVKAVANDLRRIIAADDTALAVAKRWSEDAAGHIDDAIAWLRLWSWQRSGTDLSDRAGPDVPLPTLIFAYQDALRVRERLQAPLKPVWLLHEWLVAWRATASHRQ